jgi:XTP/dITP diphosphohydrolase
MTQSHRGESIVLASNNPGKVREFGQLLAAARIHVIPQGERGVPEVAETGLTFVENAILKARNAARFSGLAALADDSGIEVDALRGAPGIYSARFAGPGASDTDNLVKLLLDLEQVPDEERTARYHCVLVYLRHADDPTPLICQGTWEGLIGRAPRGTAGFGYDPIFIVPSHGCTAAELAPEVKNRLSHRGQALRQLQHLLDGTAAAAAPDR